MSAEERRAKRREAHTRIPSAEILSNLDLDLNIVAGRDKVSTNLEFYSDDMREVEIDAHLVLQSNPRNHRHNILWRNKVVLDERAFARLKALVVAKYRHFHQPSAQQLLDMYRLSPRALQLATSRSVILAGLWKSLMIAFSEDAFFRRDKQALRKALSSVEKHVRARRILRGVDDVDVDEGPRAQQDKDVSAFLEISECTIQKQSGQTQGKERASWKTNVFHELSLKFHISPCQLAREYLRVHLAVSSADAEQMLVVLSESDVELSDLQAQQRLLKQYKAKLSVALVHSVRVGIRLDCVYARDHAFAWRGWRGRMRASCLSGVRAMFGGRSEVGWRGLEQIVAGKLRGVLGAINKKRALFCVEPIRILSEAEQRQRIEAAKLLQIARFRRMQAQAGEAAQDMSEEEVLCAIRWRHPPTPDVLLSRPVMLNGQPVNWIDAKNFVITQYNYPKVRAAWAKYNRAFGSGAFAAMGFVEHRQLAKQRINIVDCSYWSRYS